MSSASRLTPGLKGHASLVVGPEHTARRMGSGTADVLATPMMIALMEAAAVDCVERHLAPGETSLGTRVDVVHSSATGLGERVEAVAELVSAEGRTLSFLIEARDCHGLIGEGRHVRSVVERARFEARLAAKRDASKL